MQHATSLVLSLPLLWETPRWSPQKRYCVPVLRSKTASLVHSWTEQRVCACRVRLLTDVARVGWVDVCDPCVAAAVRFSWNPGGHLQFMHFTSPSFTLYSVQSEHFVHRPRSTPRGSFISTADWFYLTRLGSKACACGVTRYSATVEMTASADIFTWPSPSNLAAWVEKRASCFTS